MKQIGYVYNLLRYLQMSENVLSWGDIIRIHGVNLTKQFQESTKGLILSKGFTDSNIYYQKYSDFSQVNFYRESLFQIMPPSSFDINDELNDPANANSPNRESLKIKAQAEVQTLNNALRLKKGQPVLYGAQAIFRHVESDSYLRGLLKAADSGDGAFTIEVSASPSSQIIWKIGSHRSYQHDGDKIYFDDQLNIYHVSTDCFMNFEEKNKEIYLDTKPTLNPLPEDDVLSISYLKNRPAIKTPNDIRTAIINENKSKNLWKFIEHCKADQYDNKEKIKSHDIVYFEHTKNKGCISSSLDGNNYYLKETIDQKQTFDSYWQLIPNQVNELGPERCNDFSARNIITGKYLTYKDFTVSITSKEEVEGGGFISRGLVNLICSQNQRKLQRGPIVPKDPKQLPVIKFAQNLYDLYSLKDVEELTEDSFMIIKVDEKTTMNIQFIISAHQHLVKFLDGFSSHMVAEKSKKSNQEENGVSKPQKLMKFDFNALSTDTLESVRYILELLAGKVYGTTYADIVSSGNTANPLIQKIIVETGTTQLLIEGIHHLFKPFVFIQENTEASSDRPQKVRIQEVFQRIYKLLEKIVVGNDNNKFYLSRWVDVFLLHSKNINREYIQDCLVGILQNNPKAIQTTISQAEIDDLIQCFYGEASNPRGGELTTKYLRLFSTFIKCENRVLKDNQNFILQKFFQDTKNVFCYRFKVGDKQDLKQDPNDPITKITTKQVLIALDRQDFSPIPKYFKDWGPKWNYFLHFVNLLADVCMDKNELAIENVSILLTLQYVTIILLDSDIDVLNQEIREINDNHLKIHGVKLYPIANVHEPFLRIAHYIYISNTNFTPIKNIENISSWYRHQGQQRGVVRKQDINRTKRLFQGEKQQEQKFYLDNILNFIQRFINKCNQQNANLDILYTVLLLFKETVQLGLWTSVSQFRQLIPMIIGRIIKVQNAKIFYKNPEDKRLPYETVKQNKEGLSFNRPEILLNINSKIKATDIFKIMNDLEIDIRLRYMMNFFKGLYEATQSFQGYNVVEKTVKIEDQAAENRNSTAKDDFLKDQSSNILGGDVKKISEDQDIMLKENIWCNKFKQLTPFEDVPSEDMSKNRYLFKGQGEQVVSFDAMVLALFELPVYQNDRLLSSGLKMLKSIFEQRKDLIRQFNDILICGKGNLEDVYRTLKYMREKFQILMNPNILKTSGLAEKFSSYYISKPYEPSEKLPENRSGVLQDLFFLSRTLIEDVNLKNIQALMDVKQDMFNKDTVYAYLNEKERNNKLFQAVNIAQGIYFPLMTYIRLIGDNKPNDLHRKILFAIYHYLALLCFNNLQAKQKLMEYIPDVLPHLKFRVGAANFIYHVSLNNKMLISSASLVKKIVNGCLQACIYLDEEDKQKNSLRMQDISHKNFEKSQILFALRGILILNDEGYRPNQELLMNRFQDNKFKALIYKNRVQFISKKQNFTLSPEESYVSCFFELFSILVQSKNFINIGKLENIHPYTYCLQCLKSSNRWQVRRSIRAYINRLYYVNKDRDIFLYEQFIRKQFKIINEELEDLIYLHKSKSITDEVVIPNGIRFKFAISEIIEMILQIFITLEEMLLKPQFTKVLKRQVEKEDKKSQNQREIHDQFKKLLHNIGCLNKLYPKNIINAFIKQLYKHIQKVMLQFSEKYLEKQSQQQQGEVIAEEQDDLGMEPQKKNYVYDHSKSFFRNLASMIRAIKDKQAKESLKAKLAKREKRDGTSQQMKKLYIQLIFQAQGENLKPMVSKKYREVSSSLYKPHIQTANSRIFKVIAKPTLNQNEENIELNRRLSIVKDIIDDSPVFRKLKEDQFYKLIATLINIDKTAQDFYVQDWLQIKEKKSVAVVPLKEIFTKSFNLIMDHTDTISDQEKIFVIKIARCYITEAVESAQTYKLPVDKWDADYYSGQEELPQGQTEIQLVKRQNIIEACGGSKFIQCIFKLPDLQTKPQILNEILLLGIAYLFNGNTNCQNSMLNVLLSDPENLMLLSVQRLISSLGNLLIEIRKTRETGKLRQFAYVLIDTYDYFNVKDNIICKEFGPTGFDKFQARNQKANQQALCRIFRFLQLFCENGNNDMKKFLLHQTNSGEGQPPRKTNSINFIEITTLLLRKLFKIMNNKVVQIPSTMLEFINEITQLPCIDNQQAFMKSTFFEDLSYLAAFFSENDNLENRKFDVASQDEENPINILRAIYQKGIDLALCNFEGNNNTLMWQFLSKCQPKYLWTVIKQNLVKILEGIAAEQGVERDQNMSVTEYHRELLKNFTPDAIIRFTTVQVEQNNMLSDDIVNILSVLYILKKIQVYQGERQQAAFADKDHPDLDQKAKAQRAASFRTELIQHVTVDEGESAYPYFQSFLYHFDTLILSIEISSFNGRQKGLQLLYFPNHPVFKYLNGDTRDSIMMRVTRGTQRDKLISLLNMRDQVYEQIEVNYDLKFKKIVIPIINKQVEITQDYAREVRGVARRISFLICALLLFFIVVDHDTQQMTSTFTYSNFITEIVLRVAAAAQLLYTLWYIFLWMKLRRNLAVNKFDRPAEQGKTKLIIPELQKKKKEYKQLQGWDLMVTYYKNAMVVFQPFISKVRQLITQNWIVRNFIVSSYALSQYQSGFLSILMFVSATLLGNFVGVEWYMIHLFDIFTSYSELTNIFKAILNNFKKLALLSFLAGVFILVFNVVSLNTYSPVIWEDDLPEEACEDVIGCVLTLYTSGAIGDDMDTFQMNRFVFDIVYVVFMEMMFMNIVSGIMIDAFSELKQEDGARDEDKKSFCYICGMDQAAMQRSGSNFEKHIKKHWLWNYLYYLYCLKLKSATDFTGLEFDIDLKVKEENVEWFPALGEGDSEGELQTVFEGLQSDMEKVFQIADETVAKGITTIGEAKSAFEKIQEKIKG